MQFTQRLRPLIRAGEVDCSVRIWKRLHVKVGGRYRVDKASPNGYVEVTAIREIDFDDITPALARRSGFAGRADLLKTAKHGAGERVFLIEFFYAAGEP